MSDLKDFVIKNDKLIEYVGQGGDVVIPDGITIISKKAFYDCETLETVTIPTSVKSIEKWAFSGTNLKTVTIPIEVSCIEDLTFADCKNLKNIFLPKSIKTIKNGAFWGCSSLADITLPGVTTIESSAFRYCESLKKITFLSNQINIEKAAFLGCDSLADSNGFVIVNNILYDYIGNEINITVPNGIVEISDSAFENCENIISVKLPDSVVSIGTAAFSNCSKLKSVNLPSGISNIGERAFEFCKSLTDITLPKELTEITDCVFRGCSSLKTLNIPENIIEIGPRAFEGNNSLVNVTVEGNVTKMGTKAFGGCSIEFVFAPNVDFDILKKQQLSLAATVCFFAYRERFTDATVISEYEKYTISQKKNLLPLFFEKDIVEGISFYANEGKITIENFDDEFFYPAQAAKASQCIAFLVNWKNENISQEAIENNLEKQIDKDPFNVTDMKKVWSYKKQKDGTLAITGYKGNDINIVIPERIGKDIVTKIDDEAFSATKDHRPKVTKLVMKNIQSIIIPETIKSIGVEAFGHCTSLTDIIMPDSITKIGDYAFRYCKSLTNVTLPAKIRKIGVATFEECHNLKELNVPNSVKNIGEYAFYRCSNLIIHAPAGSYAEQYAKENKIPFVAE